MLKKNLKSFITNWLGVKNLLAIERFPAHPFGRYNPVFNNPQINISCTPFFIIGTGRSGNTLLRAMLCSHPDIAIPPEFYAFRKVVRFFNKNAKMPWPEFVQNFITLLHRAEDFDTWQINLQVLQTRLVHLPKAKRNLDHLLDQLYILYRETHFQNAKRWGDKTPLNTKNEAWIKLVFPNAKFIHMKRDGRDVALSLQKAGLVSSLEEGANRWLAYQKIIKNFDRNNRFLEVEYENLVTNPKAELSRVCNFLDIAFDENMLDFKKNFARLGDTLKHQHHASVGKELNTNSIGNARRELPGDVLKKLEKKLNLKT